MFADLDYKAQVACLTELAQQVLMSYDLDPKTCQIKCVSHWQNSTFRVETLSGDRYALRINRPVSQTSETIRSEMQWLFAISHDTDLIVPNPCQNQNGDLLTTATTECIGEVRHCVLFQWIEGEFLDEVLTPAHLERVGVFMGKLHNHSEHFQPPQRFTRKRLDWSGQMEEFWSKRGVVEGDAVSSDDWSIFHAVRERTEPVMYSTGEQSPVFGLIHNDIYQKNILFEGDEVHVIDFDNCGYAPYLLDLAVTLTQLRKHHDYADKRVALLRGYQSQRILRHIDLLDVFIAARVLLLALYMSSQVTNSHMRAYAPGYVATATADLSHWLQTGKIR